ncbi:MAG: DNA primase [Clostridia bacterium]|nr:DNA primase [Clostridia bacterium]
MALSEEFLEQLRFRNDIEGVISGYVNLRKRGHTLVGLCPFHNEKTPSFTVYPNTQSYYCFGCASGGDVITFIRQIENLDYIEAVKLLAERSGMSLPQDGYDDSLSRQRGRIYEANKQAARFYHKTLIEGSDRTGAKYFLSRNLTKQTVTKFGLGFAPNEWSALYKHLRSLGFTNEELLLANLVRKSDKNGRVSYYDNFRNRVMVPIIDLRGNVIAFGGRVLDDSKPKYINTSDTPVYKKSQGLFALNIAKDFASEYLILVEGYMDVIALHQAGFQNAIACLGTALTSEQAQIISRYTKEIVLCYDNDEAGQKATQRALTIFRNTGLKTRVVTMEGGKDADEIISKHGAGKFKKLLDQSANDTEYKLLRLRENYNLALPDGRASFLIEAAKLLATIDSSIERDIYAGRLSQELSVSKDAILLEVNSTIRRIRRGQQQQEIRQRTEESISHRDTLNPERRDNLGAAVAEERLIVHLMFNNNRLEYITSKITAADFVTAFNARLFESVCDVIRRNHRFEIGMLSDGYTPEEMGRIAKIQSSCTYLANTTAECDDCIKRIKEEKGKKLQTPASQMDDDEFRRAFEKKGKKKDN